jgi:5-hydroxyisourate hydrolase-like protein (transthyretin family)
MKLATSTALVLVTLQNPVPVPQLSQVPVGSIEGIVLRADSADPIAKAQVLLTRVMPPPPPGANPATPVTPPPAIPPVITDASGKFSFKELEPGTYRLAAIKNGFVRHEYGARTAGGAGAPISLPAGQSMKDISFRMTATAAISGRVRTSSGEPGAALNVQLMKTAYNVQGQRTFQTVNSGRTDDRGEYRLFWLTPGRYFVAVGGNSSTLISADGASILFLSSGLVDGSSTNAAAVYYPGTTDPLRATTVDVGSGGELPGIDIVLPEQQVYRVRGKVVDTSTGLPPRTVSISLIPRDPAYSGLSSNIPPNYNATTGTFDMRNVPPGAYWLRAQASESTATALITPNAVGRTVSEALSMATSSRTAVQRTLDVGADIEGVLLELGPGISIPGTLRVEGAPLPTTPSPRVVLRPASVNGMASPTLPLNADGTFTLTNVMPGEYRATVLGMPVDYFVKEARIEQTDVLNDLWVITGPVRGTLNIVVSSGAGQIDGSVIDSRLQGVPALQTILIPDQNRDRIDLIKTAVTDQSGKFTLRGVAPGNYKIFAWEAIEPNAYFDPQILRQYEDQGKPVLVTEGGKILADVKMIPK